MRVLAIGFVGVAVNAIALVSCSREQPSPLPAASVIIPALPVASAAPANDGTDPKAPILSPDDANFVDARKGAGWGDRCFTEIKQGKWGWAHAACDRALALPDVDQKVRPLLLYNEGLIARHAGDNAAARSYFTQSLALRSPTDPGRAVVEKELVAVGGQVPAPAQAKTFPCNGMRCREGQICCPGGPPGTGSCMAYDPSSPMFCRDVWAECDMATNEPCVPPKRCAPTPGVGPEPRNPVCQ